MKKIILVASAVASATAVFIYLVKRRKKSGDTLISTHSNKRSHHSTVVFAKAKSLANQNN